METHEDDLAATETSSNEAEPLPSWSKATKDDKDKYRESLEIELRSLNVQMEVLECKDVHCKHEEHLDIWTT